VTFSVNNVELKYTFNEYISFAKDFLLEYFRILRDNTSDEYGENIIFDSRKTPLSVLIDNNFNLFFYAAYVIFK